MTPSDNTPAPAPGQGPQGTPSMVPGQSPGAPPVAAIEVPKETPQYRLTEKAYLNDRVMQEGELIYWTKKPEHYMTPMNRAAREMVKQYKPEYRDPFESIQVAPEAPKT